MKQEKSKTTSQMNSLIRRTESIEEFFRDNGDSFVDIRFSDYLYSLLEERKLLPIDLVEMTTIDRSYVYHIMAGKRMPGRETVLEIAFALRLNLDTTQHLLRLAGRAPLYSRNRQDAAIIFCIHHKKTIAETIEMLLSLDFPTIGKTES